MPHREPAPLQAMLSLLEQKAPRPLSLRDLARMLGAESYDRRTWSAALEQQAAQGRLRRIGKTRYQWVTKVEQKAKPARAAAPARERATGRGGGGRTPRQVSGVYSRVRAGFGFVEVEGAAARRFDRDVLIPEGMEHGAMHGDRVEVEVVRFDPRTHRASGEVVRVVERRNLKILGVIEQRAGHWWAIEPMTGKLVSTHAAARTVPAGPWIGIAKGPAGELVLASAEQEILVWDPARRTAVARFPARVAPSVRDTVDECTPLAAGADWIGVANLRTSVLSAYDWSGRDLGTVRLGVVLPGNRGLSTIGGAGRYLGVASGTFVRTFEVSVDPACAATPDASR